MELDRVFAIVRQPPCERSFALAANSSFELPPQSFESDLPPDSRVPSVLGGFEPRDPELVAANPSVWITIRQSLEEQLQQEIGRAEVSETPVALMVIEIDRYGVLGEHDQKFRDDLVGNVASIISRNGRQGDLTRQYGSKEFALVLPGMNTADAYCLAESMREEIEASCVLAGQPPRAVWVTVSIGLALYPRDAKSPRELFAAAVAGMLEAQRNGGNRVVMHSELELTPGTRREQRFLIALPVQIWGMDIDGALFTEDAITVDITTTGAQLQGITHSLQRGCVVGVKHQTSKARYRVVWVGEAGSATGGKVGLQLIDVGKFIWGRALPRIFGDDQFVASRAPRESGG